MQQKKHMYDINNKMLRDLVKTKTDKKVPINDDDANKTAAATPTASPAVNLDVAAKKIESPDAIKAIVNHMANKNKALLEK